MKVYNFFYFYSFIYILFLIGGYSLFNNIIHHKPIQYIQFNKNSPHFILKRLLQLSFITLLFSSIACLTQNINVYIISCILNIVSIIGYRIYFYKQDGLTYLIHIIMAIPIFLLPFYRSVIGTIHYFFIAFVILCLFMYKLYLFDYVYTN